MKKIMNLVLAALTASALSSQALGEDSPGTAAPAAAPATINSPNIPNPLNVNIANTPEVKGNVNATIVNMPTPANPLPVTGVVNANILTTTNPIPVSGNVSISNIPTSEKPMPVNGTINVSNMPTASSPMPVHGNVTIANTSPLPVSGSVTVSNLNEELPDFFKPGPYYKTILMANGLLLKDVLIIEQKGQWVRLRGHLTTTGALVPMEGIGRTSTAGENLSYNNMMMLYPYQNTKEKSYYERWVNTNQVVYVYNQVPHPNQQKTNSDPDLQQ